MSGIWIRYVEDKLGAYIAFTLSIPFNRLVPLKVYILLQTQNVNIVSLLIMQLKKQLYWQLLSFKLLNTTKWTKFFFTCYLQFRPMRFLSSSCILTWHNGVSATWVGIFILILVIAWHAKTCKSTRIYSNI